MNLPKIEFASSLGKSDVVVLGWFQETTEKGKAASAGSLHYAGKRHKEIDTLTTLLRQSKHFFGKRNEISLLRFFTLLGSRNVLLAGLGSQKKWTAEFCRQVGAAIFLAQKRERLKHAILEGESLFSKVERDELRYFVQAFAEGYFMASYEFKELKKEETEPFVVQGLDIAGLKGSEFSESVKQAQILSSAVNFARSLGDKPGNFLTPSLLGKSAEKAAKEHGFYCKVYGTSELEKEKMGLLLGVAKGSEEEPKLLVMEHRGAKKGDKPIVLIGKGVTFDSGGISLKPPSKMEEMKYDMMGAATVVALMQAAAELAVPLNVVGIVAAVENMPSGRAQKPGDVAKSMTGKTVEIINTDAEGRLILADAIEYAQKYYEPQAMLDFATLTGAVVSALGTVTSGIMGNHLGLLTRLKESSHITGEKVWELPLYEEYEEDLRSNVADIRNSGIAEAGSSKGGTFLKFFVNAKIPWVHCDIAGSSWYRRDVNYHLPKHASGVMVRLVTHLLLNWKAL